MEEGAQREEEKECTLGARCTHQHASARISTHQHASAQRQQRKFDVPASRALAKAAIVGKVLHSAQLVSQLDGAEYLHGERCEWRPREKVRREAPAQKLVRTPLTISQTMATMLVTFRSFGSTRTTLLRRTVKESNSVVSGTRAVKNSKKLEMRRTQKENALLRRESTRVVLGNPRKMGS